MEKKILATKTMERFFFVCEYYCIPLLLKVVMPTDLSFTLYILWGIHVMVTEQLLPASTTPLAGST